MRHHFLLTISVCLAVSAQAGPSSIRLLPDPASGPAVSSPPASWPVPAELLGGLVAETLMFFPGAVVGFTVGDRFASTASCGSIADPDHRAECVELVQSDARAQGTRIGGTLGVGFGAGLGVSLTGGALRAGGNPWWSMGLGIVGSAAGLLVPLLAGEDHSGLPELAGLAVSAILALGGATLGYHLGAPAPATLSPSAPVLSPIVQLGPGGGLVGVLGRF